MPVSAAQLNDLLALGLDLPTVTQIVTIFERYSDVTRDVSRDVSRDVTGDVTPGAIRQRRWREKHGKSTVLAKANDVANSVTESVTNGVSRDVTGVTECRISSTELVVEHRGLQEEKLLLPELVEGQKKVSRGTRITRDWWPDEPTLKFCAEHGVRLIDRAVDEFIDYWIAIPGYRGTKLDWNATFRNRVRSTVQRGHSNGKTNLVDEGRELADQAREHERQAGIGRSSDPLGSH